MEKNLAIETIKSFIDNSDNDILKDAIVTLHPELKESKDEKIRKFIQNELICLRASEGESERCNELTSAIKYLEKQKDEAQRQYTLGVQAGREEVMYELEKERNGKNKEDNDFTIYHPLKNGKGEYECIPYSFYGSLISFSEDKDLIDFLRNCFYTEEECNEWIEKQKEPKPNIELIQRSWYMEGYHDRNFGKQPKWVIKTGDGGPKYEENPKYGQMLDAEQNQEWSEEDEEMLDECVMALSNWRDAVSNYGYEFALYQRLIDWLKSLRHKPHWKPSEEQMEALKSCFHINPATGEPHSPSLDEVYILSSLYNDLLYESGKSSKS